MTTTDADAAGLDEEAATVATLAGDDEEAITALLRGMDPSHLAAVAAADGIIETAPLAAADDPYRQHSVSLTGAMVSGTARRAAATQAERRAIGERQVRNALAALGYRYYGTGGWHVIAFARPGGTIGFVNTARGVAVATDAVLPPEVIQALTVPGQPEGPQLSGAARLGSPDAGEAWRASAPAGWVQLLADLRDLHGDLDPAQGMRAWVVAWCLQTCYGRPGEPGVRHLEDHGAVALHPGASELADPRCWPCPDETRAAMDEAGYAGLERIVRVLAAACGFSTEVLDEPGKARYERVSAAVSLAAGWGQPAPAVTMAQDVVRSTLAPGCGQAESAAALGRASIAKLALYCGDTSEGHMIGGRYFDLIDYLLRRVVLMRISASAEVLSEQFGGQAGAIPAGIFPPLFREFTEAVRGTVAALADQVLSEPAKLACDALAEMTRIYQAAGPVTMSVPAYVPGHLPWDPGEPVGIPEIAARLRVPPAAVAEWRQRAELPPPTWPEVNSLPTWRWSVAEAAAVRLGRWPYPRPGLEAGDW